MIKNQDEAFDAHNELEAEKQKMREVRAYTARIRKALKVLPLGIKLAPNLDPEDGRWDLVRGDLQEIIGSATAIADLLDIEL